MLRKRCYITYYVCRSNYLNILISAGYEQLSVTGYVSTYRHDWAATLFNNYRDYMITLNNKKVFI